MASTHAADECVFAVSWSATIMAHAPSDDGHDSRKWIGSHSIIESRTFSMVMSGSFRCAYGFLTALRRSFTATCQPMCSGAPDRLM